MMDLGASQISSSLSKPIRKNQSPTGPKFIFTGTLTRFYRSPSISISSYQYSVKSQYWKLSRTLSWSTGCELRYDEPSEWRRADQAVIRLTLAPDNRGSRKQRGRFRIEATRFGRYGTRIRRNKDRLCDRRRKAMHSRPPLWIGRINTARLSSHLPHPLPFSFILPPSVGPLDTLRSLPSVG